MACEHSEEQTVITLNFSIGFTAALNLGIHVIIKLISTRKPDWVSDSVISPA